MHLPNKLRVSISAALSSLVFLLSAGTAFAGTGLGVSPNFPANFTVGDTNVPVTLDITNNSSNDVGSLTLDSIDLTPQCGDSSTLCSTNKDPGVFSVNAAGTGSGACAATTFTIAQTDATNGKVHFTPSGAISLAVGATCTINFTVNVLKVPTIDSTGAAGSQTDQSGQVTGHDTATGFLPASGVGTDVSTVNKASPSISTLQSAGGVIGTVLNDTATLTGGVNPTGSVTFKLFPPSDPTCSAGASYTDVDPSSPYATSPGFASNAAGVWHWTADYAGDANNNATSSPCTAEPVTVTKLNSLTSTNIHDGSHNVVLSVPIGTGVHDNAHVTGSGPTPTGNVVFNLYTNANCDSATTTTMGVLSGGFAESGTTTVAAGGLGYRAYYQGDSNYNPSMGNCEPLAATKLTPLPITDIHDAAHNSVGTSASAGVTVHDQATVGGVVNAPIPTGTVDFTFYTGTLACDNTGAPSGTGIALNGSGIAHPSLSQGPLAPGSYSFRAHYNGDTNYNPADAPCEPLTITKLTPTVATDIHDANHGVVTSVNAGATVHDTATVTGSGATPTGNVSFMFFPNGSCTVGTGAAAGSAALNGSGFADGSTAQGPLSVGNFSFKAHYDGDTLYNAADGPCEPLEVKQVVAQYCSPGYWKQTQHFDNWVNHAPTDLWSSVFTPISIQWSDKGKPGTVTNPTLLQALQANGGGLNMLARAAVDGLLNAEKLNSGYTPSQVIAIVNAAIAAGNNAAYQEAAAKLTAPENCPLN